ncbi:MAG: hypothetical protein COV44_03810 [Deltaproteobacteria bacterium CG11_big_fil_rev_8_21_14_0_20_45_16]|nr:MAG: hypothetical protein COV44_03810 [Deltaproteobacteria bacterium CG11_big_fil_rev_8_21_14_0_20_45_16]
MSLSDVGLKYSLIPFSEAQTSKLRPKSVLLLVHGRGGRMKLMGWLAKRFKIESLDYILLEAPIPDDVPEMKEPGFSWYLMPDHKGLKESREKIRHFINELVAAGYSADRIYWLGFSQGGVMGIDTGLRSPHKLGGIICVSGFCVRVEDYPDQFGMYAKKQRFLATHGMRDEILSLEKAKKSYDRLKELGINLELKILSKPHSFDLKNEVPDLEQQLITWMKQRL